MKMVISKRLHTNIAHFQVQKPSRPFQALHHPHLASGASLEPIVPFFGGGGGETVNGVKIIYIRFHDSDTHITHTKRQS